jgi:hypothetical protein
MMLSGTVFPGRLSGSLNKTSPLPQPCLTSSLTLLSRCFVFIQRDSNKLPLAPVYDDDPFWVLEHSLQNFRILAGGKVEIASMPRL